MENAKSVISDENKILSTGGQASSAEKQEETDRQNQGPVHEGEVATARGPAGNNAGRIVEAGRSENRNGSADPDDDLMEDEGPDFAEGVVEEEEDTGDDGDNNNSSAPKITLELLSQGGFYDMPMARAARILGRTEGSFQRVCRGLGILRWPYRVRKSLQAIMAKTEQYLDDSTQEDGMSKAEVMRTLQAHMDDIKGISGLGMDKATKQYRQYIFKLNHKLARKAAKQGQEPPDASSFKVKGMLKAASRIQKPRQPAKGTSEVMETSSETDIAAPSVGTNSGDTANLTRPTPRRLATMEPQERGNIIGTMARSTGIQSSRPTSAQRQLACNKNDKELMEICSEMDAQLQSALQVLMMQEPFCLQQLHQMAAANPFIQQMLSLSPGLSLGMAQSLSLPRPRQEQNPVSAPQPPFWQARHRHF